MSILHHSRKEKCCVCGFTKNTERSLGFPITFCLIFFYITAFGNFTPIGKCFDSVCYLRLNE